jgi:hypothetical protein
VDNTGSSLNSNFRKACFLAIIAHIALFTTFKFNLFSLSPNDQETKTSLNIILAEPQEPKTLDTPAPDTKDIAIPSSTPTKTTTTLITKEQTEESAQSITLAISPNSITAFTDEYAATNSDDTSNSFSNFEESFVVSLPDRTRKRDSYLIENDKEVIDVENDNGRVNVKTNFLGKSVCYTFNADADFGVANFYKCDKDVDFVFEMKR